jgi:hypothetical protein
MIIDEDGDLWLFADCNPPLHYRPNRSFLIWVNVDSLAVFLRSSTPTGQWCETNWTSHTFIELETAELIREIMGY